MECFGSQLPHRSVSQRMPRPVRPNRGREKTGQRLLCRSTAYGSWRCPSIRILYTVGHTRESIHVDFKPGFFHAFLCKFRFNLISMFPSVCHLSVYNFSEFSVSRLHDLRGLLYRRNEMISQFLSCFGLRTLLMFIFPRCTYVVFVFSLLKRPNALGAPGGVQRVDQSVCSCKGTRT